jgi:hypothetical protein
MIMGSNGHIWAGTAHDHGSPVGEGLRLVGEAGWEMVHIVDCLQNM